MSNNNFVMRQSCRPYDVAGKTYSSVIVTDVAFAEFTKLVQAREYQKCLDHEVFEKFLEKIATVSVIDGVTADQLFRGRLIVLGGFMQHYGLKGDMPVDSLGIVNVYRALHARYATREEVFIPEVSYVGVGCELEPDERMRDVLLTAQYASVTAARHVYTGYFKTDWRVDTDPYDRGFCYLAMLTELGKAKVLKLMTSDGSVVGPVLSEYVYQRLKGILVDSDFVPFVRFDIRGKLLHLRPDLGGGHRCAAFPLFVRFKKFFDFVKLDGGTVKWSDEKVDFEFVHNMCVVPQKPDLCGAVVICDIMTEPGGIPLRYDHDGPVKLCDVTLTATLVRNYVQLFNDINGYSVQLRSVGMMKTDSIENGLNLAIAALNGLSAHVGHKSHGYIEDQVRSYVRKARAVINSCNNHLDMRVWLVARIRSGMYSGLLHVC